MGITKLVDTVRNTMKGLASAGLFSLWMGGKPVPAGRPRVGRWGTYYPKTYQAWIKDNWRHVADITTLPTERALAVMVEVVAPTPKSKQVAPMGDLDNFAKGPLDLITKKAKESKFLEGIWKDDRQITFLAVSKRFAVDDEEPGFKVWWCELEEENE
jgi:Holliday junction resolvase RusA-like endonuclease